MNNLTEFLRTNNIKRIDMLNDDDKDYFKVYMTDSDYIPIGPGFYEDPGGHVVHESDLSLYIGDFINSLSEQEFIDIMTESRNNQGA